MVDQARSQSLRARMAAVARSVQAEHGSVEDTLDAITHAALDIVAGTAHAGISLVIGRRHVQPRAATSPIPRKLDELQQHLHDGPCLHAIYDHETVTSPDLAREHRWTQFCPAAVDLGVHSLLAFQLFTDEDTLGALNLYGAHADAFDADAVDAGWTLATHAAIALVAAQQQSQFRSALASRDIIGQAKGMIMERYHIDAVRAFHLLTRLSQESNTKLVEVARTLIEHDHPTP